MKAWGQLENAQLENKTSDYSPGVVGRVWWNTTSGKANLDDGTNIRALLRNDGKAVFGNSGTAANNIRFHRGANGVLQFVSGSDTTAEGTLSTALNQISGRLENYTNSGKPAFGNAGRTIYITDLSSIAFDTGSAWSVIGGAATSARVNAVWTWVVGSTAQVTSGAATHDTWAGAIAAASAGDTIRVLAGAWTENVSISKQLWIEGSGYGSNLTGSITFTSGASRSFLKGVRASNNITLNSGCNLTKIENAWLASGKTFIDNGTANLVEGFQET